MRFAFDVIASSFATIFMFMTFFSLIALVLLACCFGRMRMFQKAGVAGWKAWIPFYRDYVLCELTMGKGWYFLFGLVPILMPVMRVVYAIEVTLSYGKEILFGVLYFFFPWICELVLGCGSARYLGSMDLEAQVKNIFGAPKKNYRDVPGGQGNGFQARSADKTDEVRPEEKKTGQKQPEAEQAETKQPEEKPNENEQK